MRRRAFSSSGYITPRRRATIAAKITGRVVGVYFDEGTRVKEGQLLAKLDDSDALRGLESAKADQDASQAAIEDYEVQLRNAIIEQRRAEELVKGGVQTQQNLDAARTTADSLRAKITLAKQQVIAADSRIRAQQQWSTIVSLPLLLRELRSPKMPRLARWCHLFPRVAVLLVLASLPSSTFILMKSKSSR